MSSTSKKNVNRTILNVSSFFVMCIALIRPYLISIFKISSITLIFLLLAISLLTISLLKKNKIKTNIKLIIIYIIYLLPYFYKNAYFQDGIWVKFIVYILVIIYYILYYLNNPDKESIEKTLKLLLLFSIITSVVTWIGFVFPNIYIKNIVKLLPISDRIEILKSFPTVNPGLTNHYSRNGFYIVMGIICSLYFYLKNKEKKSILLIIFLVLSLFLVGKRGHLLFLIVSLFISYIIIEKLSIKTLVKLIFIVLTIAVFAYAAIKYIPGANVTYERILRKSQGSDISTGRFDMYKDLYQIYENNNKVPIGWGQYSKSTNYYHPGVHNDYIQLYCEVGIVGFIIIIGINIIFLIENIKKIQKNKNPLLIIVLIYNLFFLTYSLTGIPHYDTELYIVYFFLNTTLFLEASNIKQIGEKNNE